MKSGRAGAALSWSLASTRPGRGPLAGPVVTAAVIFDGRRFPDGLDDSKRLTLAERERLFEEILAMGTVAVAIASRARIDRMNILRASLWAMSRAVAGLSRAAGPRARRRQHAAARPRLHGRGAYRRRRAVGVDRGGLDRRQGDPRPADGERRAGVPGLRIRGATRAIRRRATSRRCARTAPARTTGRASRRCASSNCSSESDLKERRSAER